MRCAAKRIAFLFLYCMYIVSIITISSVWIRSIIKPRSRHCLAICQSITTAIVLPEDIRRCFGLWWGMPSAAMSWSDGVPFCVEYTGMYCQDLRAWLEREGIVYGMVNPRMMHRFVRSEGQVFDFFVKRSITCPRNLSRNLRIRDRMIFFMLFSFVDLNDGANVRIFFQLFIVLPETDS